MHLKYLISYSTHSPHSLISSHGVMASTHILPIQGLPSTISFKFGFQVTLQEIKLKRKWKYT